MTQREETEITMQTIKLECESCHKMLVEGLMSLSKLQHANLNVAGIKTDTHKPDPKEIHNYDPKSAFTQGSSQKAYMSKKELTYKLTKI